MNKKIVAFAVAMVLLLGVTMGVTFALLMRQTQTLTNTFVAGNFADLGLEEIPLGVSGELNYEGNRIAAGGTGIEYTVIPGNDLNKAPYVMFGNDSYVNGASVASYVYIKIDGGWTFTTSGNVTTATLPVTATIGGAQITVDALTFEVDGNWTRIENTNVFYREVPANTAMDAPEDSTDEAWYIIENNEITVNPAMTVEHIDVLGTSTKYLSFTAYAAQQTGDAPEDIFDDNFNNA